MEKSKLRGIRTFVALKTRSFLLDINLTFITRHDPILQGLERSLSSENIFIYPCNALSFLSSPSPSALLSLCCYLILFCCFLFVYFLNFHSLIFDNQQRYCALTLYWLSKHHNTRKIFTSNYQPTLERKAKIKKKKYRHICALRISSENHRKVFFFTKCQLRARIVFWRVH